MNNNKRHQIFNCFQAINPEPTTELKYTTSFELLVAVILSAQATDAGVNKATAKLFPFANTPEKIFRLGEEGLKDYIKTINFFRNKAKNIIKTCEILIKQFNSEVPLDRESLESLPGVGRKTASVILNTVYGEEAIAVDTHIFRVANRTKLAPGKNVIEVEQNLLKTTPKEFIKNAHHWLILHGRYICVARKPKCPICPINSLCEYDNKTQ